MMRLSNILKRSALKVLEEILSVKVHLLVLATILLIFGFIDATSYSTIVVSIGLGRVLIESIVAYRYDKTTPTEQDPPA